MAGSSLTVEVAEFVAASSAAAKAHTGGCATLTSVMSPELGLNVCMPYTTEEKNWKTGTKPKETQKAKLSVQFRHWTNEGTVQMGQAIAFPETTS